MTLYTSPPESVCIDGMEIPINTDFRKWISFQKIFSAEKNDDQRNRMLCEFMYEQCILPSQQALDALVRFYVGPSSNNEKAVTQKHGKAFDFEQDSEFIYSAFYQTYGINLAAEKMHWWMFKALFKSLPNDCKFVKIMRYRTVPMKDVPKSQKQFYREMKALYSLEKSENTYRTEEQMREYVHKRYEDIKKKLEQSQ